MGEVVEFPRAQRGAYTFSRELLELDDAQLWRVLIDLAKFANDDEAVELLQSLEVSHG